MSKPQYITPQQFIEGAYTALIAQGICKVYGGELPINWQVDNVRFFGANSFHVDYLLPHEQKAEILLPYNLKMRVEWLDNPPPLMYTVPAAEYCQINLAILVRMGLAEVYLDPARAFRVGYVAIKDNKTCIVAEFGKDTPIQEIDSESPLYLTLPYTTVTAAMFHPLDYHLWVARRFCDVIYHQSESDFTAATPVLIENVTRKFTPLDRCLLITKDGDSIEVPDNIILNVQWRFPVHIPPAEPQTIEDKLNALPPSILAGADLQTMFDLAWKAGLRPSGYVSAIQTISPPASGAPMPPPADLADLAIAAARLLQTSDTDERPVIPLLSGFICDLLAAAYPEIKTADNLRALDTALKQITKGQTNG